VDPLNEVEIRVLGSLIEKEMTTPDYYPLSLNALMNACNQSSNRDPVVQFDEGTVARAVESLRKVSLVRAVQRHDSRVMKYRHLFVDRMDLDPGEMAVLGVLMLRGPQTLAEVKTRSARMLPADNTTDLEATLDALIAHNPPLVVRLPRRPGQKELRYAHLLAGEVADDASAAPPPVRAAPDADRLTALEQTVAELRSEIVDLRAQLDAFRKQFE
jgi:uncharacterized protein